MSVARRRVGGGSVPPERTLGMYELSEWSEDYPPARGHRLGRHHWCRGVRTHPTCAIRGHGDPRLSMGYLDPVRRGSDSNLWRQSRVEADCRSAKVRPLAKPLACGAPSSF